MRKEIIIEENVCKTKAVMNKMFDITHESGLNGEQILSIVLVEYFNKMREDKRIKKSSRYFEDFVSGQRCIKEWRDLANPQTPKTFEKYFLIASLFNCDFRDMVYLDFDDDLRPRGAFEFCFTFETKTYDDKVELSVTMPCIRDKMINDEEKFGFIKSDSETEELRRKIKFDGFTLLDRALSYINKNQLASSALEIIERLNSVIFAWKTRRAPVSYGLIIMFEEITGINILEMYEPIPIQLNISLPDKNLSSGLSDKLRYLQTTNVMKEKVRHFVNEKFLEVHSAKNDCVITKKANKYGLIVATESNIRYLTPMYDYITGSKNNIFAVDKDKVFKINKDDILELKIAESSTFQSLDNNHKEILRVTRSIAENALALVNKGYKYFEIEGGIIVVTPGKKTFEARLDKFNDNGQVIKAMRNGMFKFGLKINQNFIIPPIYDREILFSENRYLVKQEGKFGFLNNFGAEEIPVVYDDASIFSEGLAVVSKNGKYGYINDLGEEIIPIKFDYACDFSEGFAVVTFNGKDFYINNKGETIIESKWDNCYSFCEGVSVVEKNGKFGAIDTTGKEILPVIYSQASSCKNSNMQLISCGNLINKKIR